MSQERSLNRLLAALPKVEYRRLEPHLTTVSASISQVLYEATEKIEAVYFPETALISVVNTLSDGKVTEVGLIGGTRMVGLPVILSDDYSSTLSRLI